jgi:hypothetical protein
MIRKEHIKLALAESVGVNPFERGDRDNSLYCFKSSDGTEEIVTVRGGKAEEPPYTGLGITEAVLLHMKLHPKCPQSWAVLERL